MTDTEKTETKTYERLTVNLTRRSSAALELAAQIAGDTKTDAVNRALQVYAYLMHLQEQGGEVLVRENGEVQKLLIL